MEMKAVCLCALLVVRLAFGTAADAIQGCGGFVEASPSLIKLRKPSDPKLDYSHIIVELHTLDGLVKDRTQCAPNGYYFIPVYDKGSFIIRIKGPDGWSWEPDQVPVSVDHSGCNGNEDINFRFTGFTMSGKVLGAAGAESCTRINEGPGNVKVELIAIDSKLASAVLTSQGGDYRFTNIIPGCRCTKSPGVIWEEDFLVIVSVTRSNTPPSQGVGCTYTDWHVHHGVLRRDTTPSRISGCATAVHKTGFEPWPL